MSGPVMTAEEMLKWNEATSACFKDLVTAHPELLLLPCDIAKTKTVGELLQHIVAVEVRYAERLAGESETPYDQVPYDSAEAIYATHDRAIRLIREELAKTVDWEDELEFVTRSMGKMIVNRKGVFFHALTHSVRHYAQLMTLLRQNGISMKYPLDYLLVSAKLV